MRAANTAGWNAEGDAMVRIGILCVVWLGLVSHAGATEPSVTLRREHRQCDGQLWHHLDREARQRAAVYCEPRGGVDEGSLRWVHHDSDHGARQICVVHLHFTCAGALASDAAG